MPKQHNIREELERYILYLQKIKDQEYDVPLGGDIPSLQFRNGANIEKRKQLEDVVKSLQAILAKTERIHY